MENRGKDEGRNRPKDSMWTCLVAALFNAEVTRTIVTSNLSARVQDYYIPSCRKSAAIIFPRLKNRFRTPRFFFDKFLDIVYRFKSAVQNISC